jgi:LemA protein
LNTKIQKFPTNIFAGMLGFKQRDFFQVDAGEAEAVSKPVDVDFSADSKPKAK